MGRNAAEEGLMMGEVVEGDCTSDDVIRYAEIPLMRCLFNMSAGVEAIYRF